MGSPSFLRRTTELVVRSLPGLVLTVFLLEKTVQLAADVIEAVISRGNVAAGGPDLGQIQKGPEGKESDRGAVERAGKRDQSDRTTEVALLGNETHLIQAAQVAVKLLRKLCNWLQSLRGRAPSARTVKLLRASKEGQQDVVARKQPDEVGLVTRMYRRALQAPTEILNNAGLTVNLPASRNKPADCSPVEERSTGSFSKAEVEDKDTLPPRIIIKPLSRTSAKAPAGGTLSLRSSANRPAQNCRALLDDHAVPKTSAGSTVKSPIPVPVKPLSSERLSPDVTAKTLAKPSVVSRTQVISKTSTGSTVKPLTQVSLKRPTGDGGLPDSTAKLSTETTRLLQELVIPKTSAGSTLKPPTQVSVKLSTADPSRMLHYQVFSKNPAESVAQPSAFAKPQSSTISAVQDTSKPDLMKSKVLGGPPPSSITGIPPAELLPRCATMSRTPGVSETSAKSTVLLSTTVAASPPVKTTVPQAQNTTKPVFRATSELGAPGNPKISPCRLDKSLIPALNTDEPDKVETKTKRASGDRQTESMESWKRSDEKKVTFATRLIKPVTGAMVKGPSHSTDDARPQVNPDDQISSQSALASTLTHKIASDLSSTITSDQTTTKPNIISGTAPLVAGSIKPSSYGSGKPGAGPGRLAGLLTKPPRLFGGAGYPADSIFDTPTHRSRMVPDRSSFKLPLESTVCSATITATTPPEIGSDQSTTQPPSKAAAEGATGRSPDTPSEGDTKISARSTDDPGKSHKQSKRQIWKKWISKKK
ncbi:nascent polypeptide-associated complex subunit alpha, muscle-specific form-like [Acanthaster planci]|uniref:Nascent polypeptide-associated complex subunit alpha, muscle-specific form-like n=1 Tax=Acanthaster planci TaxID=133434 RepID=A0A8B7ZJN7_ACAPL|nr:nascent polypeptide-associated complex subunit alpha, muscle-specific form-like [Acanthaster planci]